MIKRMVKWFGYGIGGLALFAAVALVVVYFMVEAELSGEYDIAGTAVPVPTDINSIVEGARLAALRGCNGGCHGELAAGRVFFEFADGTRVIAPNLPELAQTRSVAAMERAIRHGVRPDDTTLLAAMPSSMLSMLSDADLGKILAWLNSLPVGEGTLPETRIGPVARVLLMMAMRSGWEPAAAEGAARGHALLDRMPRDEYARGRYLALTVCSECHGLDLAGNGESTPGLVAARAYTLEEFSNLMRTGEPLGDRELGLMAEVARGRFKHFTDGEILALYAYLQAREPGEI